ncbi:helix-turn-helix domain-containing protein [[Clostridium] symbiosum]|uniref:helix-turn-helix domain-containing protein n=1 Tax=Clostridium symbiosum TaxID=1512 RepID=UPI001AA10282|nr:helix-turn-helix transcriptional regulator [[Clostridium] symbiosum]MBO1695149.1 helix-turn-helix transcriptional regulator [[Clostridium] symbiosum]
MEKKTLGGRVNAARKDRNLTAEKLAEICSINATYLRQIESGAKFPSLPLFIALCNALETSPDYLLQDEVNMTKSEIEELDELWRHAVPDKQRLIIAMLKAALQHIE